MLDPWALQPSARSETDPPPHTHTPKNPISPVAPKSSRAVVECAAAIGPSSLGHEARGAFWRNHITKNAAQHPFYKALTAVGPKRFAWHYHEGAGGGEKVARNCIGPP